MLKLDPRFSFATPVDEAAFVFRNLFFGLAKQARARAGDIDAAGPDRFEKLIQFGLGGQN